MNTPALKDVAPETDAALDEILARHRIPGAAIAVMTPSGPALKCYGVERAGGYPVTDATRFSCGSTSKAFVSALGSVLAARKLTSWDARVHPHVPELQLPEDWITQAVTFRDLCGNRTGLSRRGIFEYGADVELPVATTLAYLKHTPMKAPFRDRFTYANPGHTAAAIALGRICGDTFSGTLRKTILEPLGMVDSCTATELDGVSGRVAGWHRERDGAVVEIFARLSGENELGASGMFVSGRDALQWLAYQLDQHPSSVPHPDDTHRPVSIIADPDRDPSYATPDACFSAYALGWAVTELGGHKIVRHGGNDPGMSAHVAFAPDSRVGVTAYVNRATKYCAMECNYRVLGDLLGISRDWRAMIETHFSEEYGWQRAMTAQQNMAACTLPASRLRELSGIYECPYSGPATISETDGRLILRFAWSRFHSGWLHARDEENFLLIGMLDTSRDFLVDEVSFRKCDGRIVMNAGWAGDFLKCH